MRYRLVMYLMGFFFVLCRIGTAGAEESVYLYQENYFQWFHASGWMGDIQDLFLNSASTENPYQGSTCVKIAYTPSHPYASVWAGIYWQYPVNNWGEREGRSILNGARTLRFYARGARGGEVIQVKVGGMMNGEYSDSAKVEETFQLTDEWKEYRMTLFGADLSHIIGGFAVVFARMDNPEGATVYLDEIVYEK